jgi:hypothetical protein
LSGLLDRGRPIIGRAAERFAERALGLRQLRLKGESRLSGFSEFRFTPRESLGRRFKIRILLLKQDEGSRKSSLEVLMGLNRLYELHFTWRKALGCCLGVGRAVICTGEGPAGVLVDDGGWQARINLAKVVIRREPLSRHTIKLPHAVSPGPQTWRSVQVVRGECVRSIENLHVATRKT